ncbi:Cyclic pyranopterin monophosphate synthase subunit MoaC [Planctomycetales bacterium 10988]|nr:Cyclic pyranopterin monophosphate synthase subunit MoaC [Planctomycetales bacterium 10988]
MDLSHFDEQGASRMVDVSQKPTTLRMARASAVVQMQPETLSRIQTDSFAKGNVKEVARLAGIMATKKTGELIPLCHPLGIDAVEVSFADLPTSELRIEATVRVHGRTGVEMEALTAVSVAALTIYDMCKSIDRAMVIHSIQLEEKTGGKSGPFLRTPTKNHED